MLLLLGVDCFMFFFLGFFVGGFIDDGLGVFLVVGVVVFELDVLLLLVFVGVVVVEFEGEVLIFLVGDFFLIEVGFKSWCSFFDEILSVIIIVGLLLDLWCLLLEFLFGGVI